MKNPIRVRYFFWLAALLLGFFLVNSLVLLGINLPAILARGPDWRGEFMEWAAITLTGLALLPLLLLAAWRISRHMLAPLRQMADTAGRIESGQFEERIRIPETHDEVATLAAAINRALDRYADAMVRQRHFAGTASHQLRTPLTTIRSIGEVALQKDRPAADYRDAIGAMLEESDRLSHVVEQLLVMARLSAEELRRTFVSVSIRALLEAVCETATPLAGAHGIRLVCRSPDTPAIRGSAVLLTEALGNVIDNAIRVTPAGGAVTLDATTEGAVVNCRITDSGPGFPPELLDRDALERAGTLPDRQTNGLGLVIVAQIARVHHGRLLLRNAPGGGATVTLQLPVA